ncbi:MAG: efflux RND transporter periplasmic adaptor subunit [Bryobacterales bacterium]|nr:efflux RND transporter periplasmic adaptor subunit [Bryobacterales bacterium]
MPEDLNSLRIDKSLKDTGGSRWATRWIIAGILIFLLLGAAQTVYSRLNRALDVRIARVSAQQETGAAGASGDVILNATGYIVAHHKIQLASKVVGKVAWIGVEKGDPVKQGQVIVRLEDDEYRAQLQQAKGQLQSLEARLLELTNGSRPEEIAAAQANLNQAKADLDNARISIERTRNLVKEGVLAKQALDDAQARFDGQTARVTSLQRAFDLVNIGPREETKLQVRGQIEEARGRLAFFETQLSNTVIRAPINGTILERVVERGEFVTTGFVGDRGAKGYVVSLADLNDLQVELDINQNDFAKLGSKQKAVITTDAYGPDRKYQGVIEEISPEANRQKATVQVKVKVVNPDSYLRPEMNASVAFVSEAAQARSDAPSKPVIYVPEAAVRNGAVFIALNGRAVKRAVRTGATSSKGLRVDDGLIGGEDVIVSPPAELEDGARIQIVR